MKGIKGIDEFLQMSMCNNMPLSVNEKRKIFNLIINLQSQLQQKENIIKEVREYITYWHYRNDFIINSFTTGVKEELLKILDKKEVN